MAKTEHPAIMLERLLQEKHNLILDNERLREALADLIGAVRTSAGFDQKDGGLCAACDDAEKLLPRSSMPADIKTTTIASFLAACEAKYGEILEEVGGSDDAEHSIFSIETVRELAEDFSK